MFVWVCLFVCVRICVFVCVFAFAHADRANYTAQRWTGYLPDAHVHEKIMIRRMIGTIILIMIIRRIRI